MLEGGGAPCPESKKGAQGGESNRDMKYDDWTIPGTEHFLRA